MPSKPMPHLFEGKTLIICLHDVSHMVRVEAVDTFSGYPHPEYLRIHLKGASLASPVVRVEGEEIELFLSAWRNYHRWIERSKARAVHVPLIPHKKNWTPAKMIRFERI